MNHSGKKAGSAGVHMLDRINAKAVKVGKGDPEFIDLAQIHQRGRNNVLVNLVLVVDHEPRTVMQVFQAEKITIKKFRKIIEVIDVAVPGKVRWVLELGGPDSSVREGSGIGSRVNGGERQRGRTTGVSETFYAVRIAVPARIFEMVAMAVVCYIAFR